MVQIDMTKPPECAACPMCSYEDDSCVLQSKYRPTWEEQYEHCPLVGAVVEEIDEMMKEDINDDTSNR